MTQDDSILIGSDEYFDPNATDDQWPGILGLQMRANHWTDSDGNTWDTYDAIGPVLAPYAQGGSITVSGPGGTTEAGVAAGFAPGGIDASGNPLDNALNNPGSQIAPPYYPQSYVAPDGSTFRVDEGSRPSACPPQYGYSEHAIVIELHGVYGFPNGICQFPITPEGPGGDFPSNSHWYPDIIGLGEIVVPGYEKLETIGWQSFWPNYQGYDDYCCISYEDLLNQGDPHDGSGPIANLIWTKRFGLVCRLVVGGGLWNDDVVITDFGYNDNFGDPNSVSYKITFKRFRSTQVSTVVNPDADVDQYSDIGQAISNAPVATQGTSGSVDPSTANPAGDGTNVTQAPPVSQQGRDDWPSQTGLTPKTAFTDEGAARQSQMQGKTQNPIVKVTVLPLSDSRVIGGGGIWHVFDGKNGETLNLLCQRMGVTWDGIQIDLNPQYKYTNPDNVNLSPGAVLNIALGSVNITRNPDETGPMGNPTNLVPGL